VTLIVGVKSSDGIVLAADGRVTSFINGNMVVVTDQARKLFPLGERYAIGVSGFENATSFIVDRLPAVTPQAELSACARELAARLHGDFSEHFQHRLIPQNWPNAGLMLVGYDGDGQPRIFGLESQLGFMPGPVGRDFTYIGSPYPHTIAKRMLEQCARTAITLTDARLLAVMMIRGAADADPSVGGKISLAVVTKAKYEEVGDDECERIERQASELEDRLRNAFWRELRDGH